MKFLEKTFCFQRTLILAIGLCANAFFLQAADDDAAPFSLKKFFNDNQLRLRQSAVNPSTREKPASFQFNVPKDAANSYAVDLALSWHPEGKSGTYENGTAYSLEGSPFIEWHRQTQSENEQNTLLMGGSYSYVHMPSKVFSLTNIGSVKFKDDRILTGQGYYVTWGLMPLYQKWYIGRSTKSELFPVTFFPFVDLQFEGADDVLTDQVDAMMNPIKERGSTARAKFAIEAYAQPLSKLLNDRLELSATYSHWVALSRSGGFNHRDPNPTLFQASLNYYLSSDNTAAIGVDFRDGENPEEGFDDQQFLSVAFKLKY